MIRPQLKDWIAMQTLGMAVVNRLWRQEHLAGVVVTMLLMIMATGRMDIDQVDLIKVGAAAGASAGLDKTILIMMQRLVQQLDELD